MSAKKTTRKPAKSSTATSKKVKLSADERAALRERTRELKAEALGADREKAVLAAIAEMPEPDRSMAKKIHTIVKANAPGLAPKTWYGMPAYAKDDKVVCFYKAADKFKSRYAQLGFEEEASLDEGVMWPTVFALKKLTAAEEKKITALVKKAVR